MNQQSQPVSPYPVDRGDELDLMGLWKVLVKYKLLILITTIITTLSAIYYTSTLPTIYKAEVLMIPASGGGSSTELSGKLGGLASVTGISSSVNSVNSEQAIVRLKTRSFLINYIKDKNLKSILFANQWNEKEKQWVNQKEPSDYKAHELLSNMISFGFDIHSKANLVNLSIKWENTIHMNKVADIANDLVSRLNIDAKQRAVLEAERSILFLEKELEKTSVLRSQTILYNLIEQQMQKIMLANIRDEFVFKVIDPAVVPRQAEVKPILMFILIGVALGIFLGSFLAISINYFKQQSKRIAEESGV